mgnify:CR=1 FL=1
MVAQLEPVGRAAGGLRGRLAHPEVAQADLAQGFRAAGRGRDGGEEPGGGVHRHAEDVRDVLAAVGDLAGLGVVARAVAFREIGRAHR